ncbi:hypothetical protein Halhy_1434 [Haliscomenobacter hydrossis DSM 1100]|uniref:Uncharacterized protein n=1 Tax=Haliscomenobacter hydrossis (strain ATCC 27775 / DSM 1100 / LMG 10767 / O) TaxID=760192 RepID=F4KXC0_HALH1|nr:hypothetical protein Halhy_1434 [Haliscomenobacter hydrossis DSM 1100]
MRPTEVQTQCLWIDRQNRSFLIKEQYLLQANKYFLEIK